MIPYGLGYVTMFDRTKENGFTLKKKKKRKARSRRYPTEIIAPAVYTDDQALLTNTPAQAESRLRSPEQTAGEIGFYVNANKTKFMCFKREGTMSFLCGKYLKLGASLHTSAAISHLLKMMSTYT